VEQAEEVSEIRWVERLVYVQTGEIDEIFNFVRGGCFRPFFLFPLLRWSQSLGLIL